MLICSEGPEPVSEIGGLPPLRPQRSNGIVGCRSRQARMCKVDREGAITEGPLVESYLGIDISKETFNAHLLSHGTEAKKVFQNSAKGFINS